MSKKKIKINYIDFWPGFDKNDNFFQRILDKYYEVEISDKPDYLFCSVFGRKHFNYQDCVKIFYTGENIVPDFNVYDYAMGFHYIDFEDRYLRVPHYILYDKAIPLALKKHTYDDEYYLSKKKFCNYVISNPDAAWQRDSMIDALNEYSTVDSGGRYRNNVGGPVADKIAFSKQYRFTLAFENSQTAGYTTEKIFEAYAADTIPIYWGSQRIENEFNPDSFVNVMAYSSIDEAAKAVQEIYEDDSKYLAMIKAPALKEGIEAFECLKEDYCDAFICNILNQDKEAAFRRNMIYTGRDYQKRQKEAAKVADILDLVRKPLHLLNKTKIQLKSRNIKNDK